MRTAWASLPPARLRANPHLAMLRSRWRPRTGHSAKKPPGIR
jgi:hypothetical protein